MTEIKRWTAGLVIVLWYPVMFVAALALVYIVAMVAHAGWNAWGS